MKDKVLICIVSIFFASALFAPALCKACPNASNSPANYSKADYSARINISNKVDSKDSIVYFIRVTNTGNKTWAVINEQQFNSDSSLNFIKVGCQVFDKADKSKTLFELREVLSKPIAKGQVIQASFKVDKKQLKAGRQYLIKFDVVNELKFWFEVLGGTSKIEEIQM